MVIMTLEQDLDNKYGIAKTTFNFSNTEFSIFTIKDTDKLLEKISVEEYNENLRLPYWAEIWPSAVGLASYIQKCNFKGKKILELGSGLGLAGVASGLSNGTVTFSDYEQEALNFCKLNAEINGLEDYRVNFLDWTDIKELESYDIIIAADVIYEKEQQELILNILNSFLSVGGKFYLAEPNRKIAFDFFNLIKNNGFDYQKYLEQVRYKSFDDYISIYEIYPK